MFFPSASGRIVSRSKSEIWHFPFEWTKNVVRRSGFLFSSSFLVVSEEKREKAMEKWTVEFRWWSHNSAIFQWPSAMDFSRGKMEFPVGAYQSDFVIRANTCLSHPPLISRVFDTHFTECHKLWLSKRHEFMHGI